jgi:transcriptional regulator with XRE-family HTH domain
MSRMKKLNKGPSATVVDAHVGVRIRERRIVLGLTQQQLTVTIGVGVTYQQMNKYERGINRVSAGRLYDIACALNVPIGYFYEGLDQEAPQPASLRQRMRLDIARNFSEIQNEKHQVAVHQLARVLAGH